MLKKKSLPIILFLALSLGFAACDGGLEPPTEDSITQEPGISGLITFEKNTWPPADSLIGMWIFASQLYPLDSVLILTGLFSDPPKILLYPDLSTSLPLYVDSISYRFKLPPGLYRYIGIIQQMKPELAVRSLRVVGVYASTADPSQPVSVSIGNSQLVRNINFHINFYKIPPQPF
ncbi:MAG: hypothetical protein V1799_19390 [bacterium]